MDRVGFEAASDLMIKSLETRRVKNDGGILERCKKFDINMWHLQLL